MSPDGVLAGWAAARYGVITRRLAFDAGLSDAGIKHRLETGRWIGLHPGIYLIAGTVRSWRSDLMAACDWARCGIASHRSAAVIWGLEGFRESGRPEITVGLCHLPPRAGIRVHFTDRMPGSHVTARQGFPITSIERTLLDLGAVVPQRRVAIALDAAVYRGLTTIPRLTTALVSVAKRGRRGCGVLRRILSERETLSTLPNSPLETVFFEALAKSPFPMPKLQYEIVDRGEFVARPDFAWLDRGIAIELDGYDPHAGLDAFNRDRWRFNSMTGLGWRVVYGTWVDANSDPDAILEHVRKMWNEPPPPKFLEWRGQLQRSF